MATEDDPATKRDLVQLEERLTERFTGRLQQTQADVQLQMSDMQQQMRDMQAETQQQMRDMKAELQEQMGDMQTELLKAFLPWHDNVGIQFRELEVNTGNTL